MGRRKTPMGRLRIGNQRTRCEASCCCPEIVSCGDWNDACGAGLRVSVEASAPWTAPVGMGPACDCARITTSGIADGGCIGLTTRPFSTPSFQTPSVKLCAAGSPPASYFRGYIVCGVIGGVLALEIDLYQIVDPGGVGPERWHRWKGAFPLPLTLGAVMSVPYLERKDTSDPASPGFSYCHPNSGMHSPASITIDCA